MTSPTDLVRELNLEADAYHYGDEIMARKARLLRSAADALEEARRQHDWSAEHNLARINTLEKACIVALDRAESAELLEKGQRLLMEEWKAKAEKAGGHLKELSESSGKLLRQMAGIEKRMIGEVTEHNLSVLKCSMHESESCLASLGLASGKEGG